MAIDKTKIDKWFNSKPLGQSQDPSFQEIRLAAKRLAEVIVANTPPCADQSAAIREVRKALQWSREALIHETK